MLLTIAVVAFMIIGLTVMAALSPNGMDYRSREVRAQWRRREHDAVHEQRKLRRSMLIHRLTHRVAPVSRVPQTR
ncbi:hypothetical protein [Jongsikchunia kroppenstedtii]|uniref:hypothetical protein n=1 Tax=Jongsikchunia kroppenstedtii TaxID=1121721 RepID=UPI00037A2828|nr:hypothetical protein [Jongsikchunia kroppenstedtii]